MSKIGKFLCSAMLVSTY